jgi:glucosamine--fructose-6-phosphate aminotransferase (isomerizing)
MAAELAELAMLPSAHAGTVLLARGSSDNVAVYGRYLIEMASGRPAGAIAAAYDSSLVAAADLAALPDAVASLLGDSAEPGASEAAETVAGRWSDARRLVVTGRGLAYAAALETALKIKETAQVPDAEQPLPEGISEITAPILAIVRGQQFALASSLRRGLNPDAPAGLSKVTATH